MLVHSLAVFSDPRSLSRSTKQILSVTNLVISLRLAHLSTPLPDGETGGKKGRTVQPWTSLWENLLCHQAEPMKLPRFSFPKVAACSDKLMFLPNVNFLESIF